MSSQGNEELGKKLDQLIVLTAMALTATVEKKTEKILMLGQAGLDRNIIAKLCGTTPHSVSVVLSAAKKGKP